MEQTNLTNLSNLSKGSQLNFAIPYFDVFDPRLQDYGVPVAVHGAIVYAIEDMDLFHSVNRNEAYSDETFKNKLRGQLTKFIKSVVVNAPIDAQIPVVQIERKIMEISELVQQRVMPQVEKLFGITIRSLDITSINIDKESRGYRELRALTIEGSAFSANGFIGELELPKSLTVLEGYNFQENDFSGSFKIPKGLLSISSFAFSNCAFTGEAEIPDGVTCIHGWAFSNSENLQKIILPSSLELIDVGAFYNCKSLRVIECKSTVPPVVNESAFNEVPLEDLTVIVPKSALNDYKSSESWSGFKHIIAK